MKNYDRKYFDHWYHSGAAVVKPELLQRRVRHAVAAAEFTLGREIASVLDVGCGEALWRAPLKRMRPGIRYVGIDSSDYVVRRFGARRNIRKGDLARLGKMALKRPFDLVICSDVIAYVSLPDLRRGLAALRKLTRGIAYIDAYTTSDDFVGDRQDWNHRSEATYRKAFAEAGLVSCGLNCWIAREQLHLLSALEHC